MTTLGVDLGATNTKFVVLDHSDRITELEAMPTRGEEGHDAVLERLVATTREHMVSHGASAVGVGTPGLFDEATGVVTIFTNLPGQWVGVPLRERLETGLGVPVTLINDARAFTLAEGTLGAGRGARIMAGLTLGTGVGGGLLADGALFRGAFGTAGEIAHQTYDAAGELCGCGNRGCAEAAARADVLTATAGRTTVADVYAGYADGDPRCIEAVEHAARALGIALANVITVVGPERIVIGGGIATAGRDAVLDPIRRATLDHVTLVPHDEVQIVVAALGSAAGAIGAALAARADR